MVGSEAFEPLRYQASAHRRYYARGIAATWVAKVEAVVFPITVPAVRTDAC